MNGILISNTLLICYGLSFIFYLTNNKRKSSNKSPIISYNYLSIYAAEELDASNLHEFDCFVF